MNKHWLWLALILLLTFGLHAPSIGNDFVYDDNYSAKETVSYTGRPNPMIAELQPISVYFTSHYLYPLNPSRSYRPMAVFSYALVYHVWGKYAANSAMPQHLLNVVTQTLNTWLVFLLVFLVCGRRVPALLAALVFGVHAVHSGAVASIVGRCELFAFCFGALATLTFSRAVRADRSSKPLLALTGLLLYLAMCSKESGIAWVVMMPLWEMARRWSSGGVVEVRKIVGLAAGTVVVPVALFITLYFHATAGMEFRPAHISNPLAWEPLTTRLASAALIWVHAIEKVLAPFSLSCDYGPVNGVPMAESLFHPQVLVALALLVALVVSGVVFARRSPLFFLAVAAFFGFSFITSNVPFAQETIFAERGLYTPSLGLGFLVAGLALRIPRKLVARVGATLLALWCVASAFMTVERMLIWKDTMTLLQHDLQQRPSSLRCLLGVISELQKGGQAGAEGERKSLPYYARILEDEPGFPLALLNLGMEKMIRRDARAAADLFQRGLDSPLLHKGYRAGEGAKLSMSRGRLYQQEEDLPRAEELYEQAVRWDPRLKDARWLLLRVQLERGRVDAAAQSLVQAARAFQMDPRQILRSLEQGAGSASPRFRKAVQDLARKVSR